MAESRLQILESVLAALIQRYQQRVPDVQAILRCMLDEGLIHDPSEIENDHIAFRTLGVPFLGISSLEKIFLYYGYQKREGYHFPAKKLDAFWYAPPRDHLPRIFISELRVPELSQPAQATIHSYTDEVSCDPVDRLDLDSAAQVDEFLHQPLWRIPTFPDYQQLLAESEYAAWVIYNRYYLNHFTISVHQLPAGYNTLPKFNAFLERHGFALNDAGGKIKVSPDQLLLQSSTVAALVPAEFDDGRGGRVIHRIPGSYVEFAERKVLPEYRHLPAEQISRAHRREGFEAHNADRIFESTYSHQTQRQQV